MQAPSPPVTTLCLVRHGETDWNLSGRRQGREDLALNATGRRQARLAGLYLQQWSWDAIVASPLSRALETARIIGETLGAGVDLTLPGLVERDYGAASGLTPAEADERWPDGVIPGLEPLDALHARAGEALDELTQRFAGRQALVVAHGGLINALLAVISDGEVGSGKTTLANACICRVSFAPPSWRIDEVNSIAHLQQDTPSALF